MEAVSLKADCPRCNERGQIYNVLVSEQLNLLIDYYCTSAKCKFTFRKIQDTSQEALAKFFAYPTIDENVLLRQMGIKPYEIGGQGAKPNEG